MSPFLPAEGTSDFGVSACLFEWSELLQASKDASEQGKDFIADFRTLSPDSSMRRAQDHKVMFPQEFQSMEQLQKIIDEQMKMQ